MEAWNNIYITDKSGKKFFSTTASPMATMSEIRNITRHLNAGASSFDKATALLMMNGEPYVDGQQMSDDELLEALGA